MGQYFVRPPFTEIPAGSILSEMFLTTLDVETDAFCPLCFKEQIKLNQTQWSESVAFIFKSYHRLFIGF